MPLRRRYFVRFCAFSKAGGAGGAGDMTTDRNGLGVRAFALTAVERKRGAPTRRVGSVFFVVRGRAMATPRPDSSKIFFSPRYSYMAPSNPSRRWCFTLNNPTDADTQRLESLHAEKFCKYVVWKPEIGERGTLHLQGYLVCSKPQRLAAIAKRLLNRAHLEVARGSDSQAIAYVKKQETAAGEIVELGEIPKMGQRTDLSQFVEAIKSGLTDAELYDEYPKQMCMYPRVVEDVRRTFKIYPGAPDMSDFIPWEWQRKLLEELEGEPDPRKIIWYYDPAGGNGKSTLTKYLVLTKDAVMFGPAKSADIKHAYGQQPVVIFDFPRTCEGYVPYDAIESIKNGLYFSSKYSSSMRVGKTPHLVVFANFEPELRAMSQDRWDVRKM